MKRIAFFLMLLTLACLLPAQNQPLTITAPNGGEVWMTGTTNTITWTETNLVGNVVILLLGQDAPAPTVSFIAQGIPVTDGQYSWLIPETIPTATTYRIRVAMQTSTGTYIMDFSDAYFTIVAGTDPPPPNYSVTVTSPNGGEQWAAGSTQNITWNYTGITGEVYIALVNPNSNILTMLAPAVPVADQSYQWTIPADFNPGVYKINIVWITIMAIYVGDTSDNFFTITNGTPPPPQPITVTAPNGGETWVAGTMHPITWNYTGNGGMVMIQLMGGPEMTPINIIANNVPANAGFFAWHIPQYQMPGDAYMVQINMVDAAGVLIGDISDAPFSIMAGGGNTPAVTVISPNGGELWTAGSTYQIHWNYANFTGDVYIGLIGENTNSLTIIAQSVPVAAQNFLWTIPADIMPGNYMIQIVCITDPGMYIGDISDGFFQIGNGNPPPPQGIQIISPNGGEVWNVGFTYPIHWLTTNPAGFVSLVLIGMNDPTAMTMVIADNLPAGMLVFNWTIPDFVPAGTNYQVMVSMITPDGVAVQDASDAPFTIDTGDDPPPPPQSLTVTTPNGGEQWTKGSTQSITWTDTDLTGNVRIFLTFGSTVHPHRLMIGRNVPNTGSYSWTIPMRLHAGSHFKVVIRKMGGVMDASDGFFSIVAPTANLKASPNPTPQGTDLSFELKSPVSASVRIYNLKGQCVRVLLEDQMLSGSQNIRWDGNDQVGRKVSAGIYFARIVTPEFSAAQKIIILK